ncbi:MAG: hypothetical protein ACPIOQ_71400, partial [Promethearchaeia archaeon]
MCIHAPTSSEARILFAHCPIEQGRQGGAYVSFLSTKAQQKLERALLVPANFSTAAMKEGMAARNAASAGKSGQGTTSAGRTDKPTERKSVDGDGCWDV